MKKLFTAALLLVSVITFSACNGSTPEVAPIEAKTQLQKIVERGTLVLGTSGNMTPMTRSINDGKDAVGFDIDLAKTLATTMGVELEIKILPFDQLISAVDNGEVDIVISNMTITPQRNTQAAFVGPYLTSGKCLVTKEADLATAGKKEELNKAGLKIAVIKGTTSETFVKLGMPNVEAVAVTTQNQAVELIRESQVSALLTDYPICKSIISSNPDDNFVSVFSNLTYEPIGIAVAPQNSHLVNYTENFLIRANKVGLLEALANKWFK